MINKDGDTIINPTSPLYHRHLGADEVGSINDIDYICGCKNHLALVTVATVPNRITAMPFTAPPWPSTLSRIAIECTAAGAATLLRLAVYLSIEHDHEIPRTHDMRPGKLLYDSGDIAVAASILSAVPNIQLTAGWRYWLAVNYDAALTARGMAVNSATEHLGCSADTITGSLTSMHRDFTFAAMPTRFGAVLAGRVTNVDNPVMRYNLS